MSAKKKAIRKRSKAKTAAAAKTRSSTKKPTRKKPVAKKQAPRKKATTKRKTNSPDTGFSRRETASRAAGQSGDLQGLSRREDVDSESVEELVEEGNIFEAGVVSGVEEADDSEEKEVHTREVPEDDVPGEYLDKD